MAKVKAKTNVGKVRAKSLGLKNTMQTANQNRSAKNCWSEKLKLGLRNTLSNVVVFVSGRKFVRRVVCAGMLALATMGFFGTEYGVRSTAYAAGIAHTVNYQGRLLTTGGTSVADGTYQMQFRLYSQATGGSHLWSASTTDATPTGSVASMDVTVTSGLFSVLLGDNANDQVAFPEDIFNNDGLYLGVTIGADSEMTPRKRLSAVPYAYNSETLQGQYASHTVANTGGSLFSLNLGSTDAAVANRSAFYVHTSGTSNVYDFLMRANSGSDVFTITRQGNVTTTGNLQVDGHTILGSSTADRLEIKARISSDLIPATDVTYGLGTSSLRWKSLYAANVSSTNLDVSGYVSTTQLYVNGSLFSTPNFQSVTDQGYVTTNPIQVAGVSSTDNILPTANNSYDLGSTTNYWNDLFTTNVSSTNLDVDRTLYAGSISADGSVTFGNYFGYPTASLLQAPDQGAWTNVLGNAAAFGGAGAYYADYINNGGSYIFTEASSTSPVFEHSPLTGGTHFGYNVAPYLNNSKSLGLFATAWKNLYVSSTSYLAALDIGGNVVPRANSTYDLGSTTNKWRNLFTTFVSTTNLLATGYVSTSALYVNGTAVNLSNYFVQNGNSNNTTSTLGTNDNFNLAFETNNTARMVIEKTGFVGMGVVNPDKEVDIMNGIRIRQSAATSSASMIEFTDRNSTWGQGLTWNTYYGGSGIGWKRRTADYPAILSFGGNGDLAYMTADSGAADSVINLSYKLMILNSGYVGIGDDAPDSKLDILDTAAANTQLTITNTNAGSYDVTMGFQLADGTNLFTMGIDDSDSDKFKISTTGLGTSDRLVIDSTGKVGIGDSTPDEQFEILSTGAADTQLSITNTNAGSYDVTMGFQLADGTNLFTMGIDDSDSDKFKISTTGLGTSDRLVIDSTGNIGIGTTSPTLFKLQMGGHVGPSSTNAYDLGSSTYRWRNLFTTFVSTTNLLATGYVSTTALYVNGTQVTGATPTLQEVTDQGYVTTNPIQVAGVSSTADVLPTANNSYDLGSITKSWRNAYVSSTLSVASSTLYVNGTNGKVGIGTSSPAAKFQVVGKTYLNGGLDIGDNAYYDAGVAFSVQSSRAYIFNMYDNAVSPIMALKQDGKLTLGALSGGSLLNVKGSASIGSTYYNIAAPNNGLLVEGNVGIGTTSPTLFKLQMGGHVGPSSTNAYDLGSSTYRWRNIFASAGIYSSTTVQTLNLTVSGNVASDLIPSVNNTYSLGSISKSWKNIYASSTAYLMGDVYTRNVTTTGILYTGATRLTADAGGPLTLIDEPLTATPAAGTRQGYIFAVGSNYFLDMYAQSNGAANGIQNASVRFYQTLRPDQNNTTDIGAFSGAVKSLYVSSTSYLAALDVGGNVVPRASNTYDLGSTTNKWRTLYSTFVTSTNIFASGYVSTTALYVNGTLITAGGSQSLQQVTDIGAITNDWIEFAGATSTSDFRPNANNSNDLGSMGFAWNDVYASGTIRTAKLEVLGSSDATQLTIRANSTQSNTNPILVLTQANGTELTRLHADNPGNLFVGANTGRVNNVSGVGTEGVYNTFIGGNSGYSNTTGTQNTATGFQALYNNTVGQQNTALGYSSLYSNTTGNYNSALGFQALQGNTGGHYNVAIGYNALYANSVGSYNTAIGLQSLFSNTGGNYNAAFGLQALLYNTSGSNNAAFGLQALTSNTTGDNNAALGYNSLFSNITGSGNVAMGLQASYYNKSATNTTAIGGAAAQGSAGYASQNGTYIGYRAGFNVATGSDNNTMIGYGAGLANTSGANNLFVGYQAGDNITTGSNNIVIGYDVDAPLATGNSQLNIGNAIYGDLSTGNVGIGTTSPTLFKLQMGGHVGPSSTNAYDLGSSTYRWRNIFASAGIYSSTTVQTLNLTVSGNVASDLIPSVNNTYSLGSISKSWKNIYASSTAYLMGDVYTRNVTTTGILYTGATRLTADAGGPLTLIDEPLTATPAAGTRQGYIFAVGSNYFLDMYAQSNGAANGIQNASVRFYQTLRPDQNNTTDIGAFSGAVKSLYVSSTSYLAALDVGGNVVPRASNTYDLGSTTNKWRTLYSTFVTSTNIFASGYVSTTALYVNGTQITGGGSQSLQQVTDIGAITNDWIEFAGATSTSNLLPGVANSYNLGSSAFAWKKLFATNVSSTNMDVVGYVNVGTTTHSLFVDSTNTNGSWVGINTNTPVTYSGKNFALNVKAKDAYGVLRMQASAPLIKWAGDYNAGNGAELYQSGGGVFMLNTNSNTNGFAIEAAGSSIFSQYVGTYAVFGAPSSAYASGKVHIRGNGSTAGTSAFYIENQAATNLFTVKDGGNVGIGVATPANKLTLTGTGAATADADIGFNVTSSATTLSWTIGADKSDAGKFKISSSTALGTNDRFVIDGNGNVGVGTNSPTLFKLQVSGNVGPSSTLAYDLGSSANRWKDVWASSTRIGTSTWDVWQSNQGFTISKDNLSARYMLLNPSNVGVGLRTLNSNTTGTNNAALGLDALRYNTTGGANSAVGWSALNHNTTAEWNSAFGAYALFTNSTGTWNTAIGGTALQSNTNGDGNSALGIASLISNTTGDYNIGIGYESGSNLTTGSRNILIGYQSDAPKATGSYQLNIGNLIYGTNLDGDNATLSTGNIGIGTSNPYLYKLTVAGSVSPSTTLAYDLGSSTHKWNGIWAGTVTTTRLYVNGVEITGGASGILTDSGPSSATLGDELLTNGTFASNLNSWTSSGTWVWSNAYSNGAAYHAGGSGAHTLSQNINTTAGTYYLVTTNYSAISTLYPQTITLANATTTNGCIVAGDHGCIFLSSNTGANALTITSNALGYPYLNGISVKALTATTPAVFSAKNSDGSAGGFEVRPGGIGLNNAYIGYGAGLLNTTGTRNTALGYDAMSKITVGSLNTAIGFEAMKANSIGHGNVAVGYGAMLKSIGVEKTVAIGYNAGNNTLFGRDNVYIGYNAKGSNDAINQTVIGSGAVYGIDNSVRLGNTDVTHIGGQADWSNDSDVREKKDIVENNTGLEFVRRLRPVSFKWITSTSDILMDGFIAQDIKEIRDDMGINFNALWVPEEHGGSGMMTLSYAGFVMPLTNAVQELDLRTDKLTQGFNISPLFATGTKFLAVDADGNLIYNGATILAKGDANSTTLGFDSHTFSLNGSGWNEAASSSVATSFQINNHTVNSTSSGLEFKFATGTTSGSLGATATVFTISNQGNVTATGDLTVGKRLFLGSKTTGFGSSSTYLFVDDTLAPTSTYIATNADGWMTSSTYDYAERYESKENLQPGDLVTVDANGINLVKRATSPNEPILGIVSTKPGFVTGGYMKGNFPIALAGRVPTRVSIVNGPIQVGDYLTASMVPGVAVKAIGPGNVVGVALESYGGGQEGLISVFVKPSYTAGSIGSSGTPTATTVNPDAVTKSQTVVEGLALISAGAKQVHISYSTVLAYPMVYATPNASLDGASWWIDNRSDTGFDIIISVAQTHDVEFSWLVRTMLPGTIRFISDNTYYPVDNLTGQLVGPQNPISPAPTSTPTVPTPTPTPTPETIPDTTPTSTPITPPVLPEAGSSSTTPP